MTTNGTKRPAQFHDKHVGKPNPWDGEKEEDFKVWNEKFTTFMANAGDKKWRKILKAIQCRGDTEDLEEMDDVEKLIKDIGFNEDEAEEMLEILYDQLTQYTTGELLADVRMLGPMGSMESYRRAIRDGKRKTAENIHRARNRVTRPEIAEKIEELEDKYRKWKKDIAYLKNIDAYDFGDAGMVSILLDMIPDETQKEINQKYDTVGEDAVALKEVMVEVEKIIAREKDRKQSRKDRKPESNGKKLAYTGRPEKREVYVWDQEMNDGYGGFIAAAKRMREDDDEDGEEQAKVRREGPSSQEYDGPVPKGKGKGKGGKGPRKCFTCGEEGHFKAQCPHRWYVPKTVFGSWWNTLPFAVAKGKGKTKGNDTSKGKGKGKAKGKGQYSPYQVGIMEGYGVWDSNEWPTIDENRDQEWNQIGALTAAKKTCRKKTEKPRKLVACERFNFNVLVDEGDLEDPTPEEAAHMARAVHGTRARKQKANATDIKSKPRMLVKVEDEAELDKILEEHRAKSIAALTKVGDTMGACTQEQRGWKKISMAIDSGACENVIDASEEVPDYEVKEGKASKMGVKYASATGEEIPNLGEVMLPMVTIEGSRRSMKMQAAEVSRPLASVKRICEAGHTVVFDQTGSFMYNKRTGEVNYFREDSGNYIMDVWVPPADEEDFARQ